MPQIALTVCIGYVIWLMWQERKARPLTAGFWVPCLWLCIVGSRPVSTWLNLGSGYADTTAAYNEGNAFERNITFGFIGLAAWILRGRQFDWRALIRDNRALALFYGYLLLSTLWSDFPFVAFKRWFKEFGGVLIVLVLLTGTRPGEVLKTVYARVAFLLFPLSAVFIKWYPQFGRLNAPSGEPMNTGVTTQKNALGELIFVFGLVMLWDLLEMKKLNLRKIHTPQVFSRVSIFALGLWLLYMSHSATSLVCLTLGSAVLLAWRLPVVQRNRRSFVKTFVAIVLSYGVADQLFGVTESVVGMLGRDMTFTGRTEIWRLVRETDTNPLIGVGFSSFWSSSRAQVLWDTHVHLVSAHNGYLDVYLDGGLIGVGLLIVMLISVFRKISREMRNGSDFAVLQFIFFLICVTRNLSETSFLRGTPLWLTFLFVALMPAQRRRAPEDSKEMAAPEQAVPAVSS